MAGQILRWWLVLEILGVVGLPWSVWLFRRLPDRGVSFARPLGILLVGYLGWLLSSIGVGSFGTVLLWFVIAATLCGGLLLVRRTGMNVLAAVRENIAWLAWTEGLFAGMLLLGLVLRWHAPWGFFINHTEMNMDFMFLNGILASPAFPPQDPWLAGYPINYYYVGYVFIALITRLSGLISNNGFTMALPTIFALTATGVAGIIWNATGLLSEPNDAPSSASVYDEGEAETGPTRRPTGAKPWLRLLCATLGVVLVLVMGNQTAAVMYITGLPQAASLGGRELVQALSQSLEGKAEITFNPTTPQVSDPKDWSSLQVVPRKPGRAVGDFFWWPSRSAWDTRQDKASGQPVRQYNITEFPLFSFILGDLHPHVLALPWTLLAIALALNLLSRKTAPEFTQRGTGRVELALTGIILGSLYAINSWDLPTYLLLYLVAMGVVYRWIAQSTERIFWGHLVTQASAVVLVAFVAWLPFYMSFTSLVGGHGSPLLLATTRTGLQAFVMIFGLFFVPMLANLIAVQRPQRHGWRPVTTLGIVDSAVHPAMRGISVSWPVVTAGALVIGLLAGWPLLWLLPLAIWAFSAGIASQQRGQTLALLLLALGAAVLWGTDVVFLRDVFNSRMNTIFKFFYQVWLLWGTGAGIALFFLLRRVKRSTVVWFVPWAILFAGGLFYVQLAPNWHPVQPTLNGLQFLERDRAGDARAITWIRDHTAGDAVILEAPGGGYNSLLGLISMATGRPTVIGWSGHESQWRGGQPAVASELAPRERDAGKILTSSDRAGAQPLMDKYNVEYVYIGANERDYNAKNGGAPGALEKFGSWMNKAYESDGVVIYRRRH
ncbi:MAG: DUF2298 domain-containing protein [Herpetosiphon sp.]